MWAHAFFILAHKLFICVFNLNKWIHCWDYYMNAISAVNPLNLNPEGRESAESESGRP
jgi:hypothetical protein